MGDFRAAFPWLADSQNDPGFGYTERMEIMIPGFPVEIVRVNGDNADTWVKFGESIYNVHLEEVGEFIVNYVENRLE